MQFLGVGMLFLYMVTKHNMNVQRHSHYSRKGSCPLMVSLTCNSRIYWIFQMLKWWSTIVFLSPRRTMSTELGRLVRRVCLIHSSCRRTKVIRVCGSIWPGINGTISAGTCWWASKCPQRSRANCAQCPFKIWHSCKEEEGGLFFPFLFIFLPH